MSEDEKKKMSALKSAKRQLRTQMRSILSQIPPASITSQSDAITTTLLAHPAYLTANRLSIYLSMPTAEVDTTPIIQHALTHHKKVFVPHILPSTANPSSSSTTPHLKMQMDMLALHSLSDYTTLTTHHRNAWGIPAIPPSSLSGRASVLGLAAAEKETPDPPTHFDLDLVILPGVAFDAHGHRLGHGKGFYDTFLQRYHESRPQGKMPFLIALALTLQLIPSVPTGPSDWRVDCVITGDGRLVEPAKADGTVAG